MKKLLLILLIINTTVFGQYLGFNGAGFFENYDADAKKWLHDWNQPFTLRVPGGAISKFHDPYNVRKGWGMDKADMTAWYKSVGFDEDNSSLDKWLRKADEQPNHSFMDDLIAMQKEFPNMTVLYVLNVLNSTPEANMQALRYMINGGVKITGVEAGNEVYGKYASFDEYIKDFEPIFKMVRKEFPNIQTGLCAAPMKGQKEKDEWNRQMSNYKGDYDAAIVHFYYISKELPEASNSMPENVVYDEDKYEERLDQSFRKAIKTLMDNNLFEHHIEEGKRLFPGKKIWVTEWNTKPSNLFNNTILNGAWQFRSMVQFKDDVEYMTVHNGVSPDKFGMISRANKFDSEKTELVRRMGYWAFQLAAEIDKGIELKKDMSYVLKPDDDNTVCYYFTNFDAAFAPDIKYGDVKVNSATIHFVSGKYIYSSSGNTGFMGKGTKPGYEVDKITVEKFTGTVPKNSFGYIEFEITK